MRALAERSGLDGDNFLACVASADGPKLGALDREMRLSERELRTLAAAYVYEKDDAEEQERADG